jgi:dTDP-4-dehydrorhamnose reductase
MLGSMLLERLSRGPGIELLATARGGEAHPAASPAFPRLRWVRVEAEQASAARLAQALDGCAWVINAIGVIKPHIHDDDAGHVERALRVNALFPHLLARAAEGAGFRVLQIATDCVFSGRKGSYREADPHDALDVYGKTKSLGEVFSPRVSHLRCSIIGPETKGHFSLLDWFRGRPRGAKLSGFANHRWNGVTTYHFARLCEGVIRASRELPHLQHVVPDGGLSKAELLRCMAREFGREDVEIAEVETTPAVDRTLATDDEGLNRRLWDAAGYPQPPSIAQMVSELAAVVTTGDVRG